MHQNTYMLIDPYLSDYVDRNCSTDSLQWKKKYAPSITPETAVFMMVYVIHFRVRLF